MDRTKRVLQTFLRLAQDLKQSNPLLLLALGLVPLCLVLSHLQVKNSELQVWTKRIETLEEKALAAKKSQNTRQQLWQKLQQSNPQYLSQAIETLPLLGPEFQRVQALARQYPSNTALQERLAFLQGDKNRIRFVQQEHHAGPFFQETEHKIQNSVQMNEDDLRKLLPLIEDHSAKDHPLLIIKGFDLKRIKEKSDEMVYNIQLELIQRNS